MHLSNDAEWEALIGKGIVSFGRLEVLAIKFLAHFYGEDITTPTSWKPFSERADDVIAKLETLVVLHPNEQGLRDGFRRAKTLVKTRNLIAHNPVMLDLYTRDGSDELAAERSIRSILPDEAALDLAALKEFVAEVENLAAKLWYHYLQIVGSAEPLWRRLPSTGSTR